MFVKYLFCMACASLLLTCGCGKNENESIAKKTGRKVGENISDFTKGIGNGMAQIGKVKVTIDAEVKKLGLNQTIAKNIDPATKEQGIVVYMISANKVYAVLCAKAFNKDNLEIGRSSVKVDFDSNDAKYVKFVFPADMDMAMVNSYDIELVK